MFLGDFHTHTAASGHGTNATIFQMVQAAQTAGLTVLGITDHGPATTASCRESYFRSLLLAPRRRLGIRVLYGAEVSILDAQGHTDLPDDLLARLDYVILSMHRPVYTGSDIRENTRAFINAMNHPNIKILGHCDDPRIPLDYEHLIDYAGQKQILMEINEASLDPLGYRSNALPNCRRILHLCQTLGLPLVLSSDSHGPQRLGTFPLGKKLVDENAFPQERIVNTNLHLARSYFPL